jgi:CRISPR-associated endonuclease/helicase Cas3
MPGTFAHSRPGEATDTWELLTDHLNAVAERAAEFANAFGWSEAARLSGGLHDIGKLAPEFQSYIRNKRNSGGDHSIAGALIALQHYGPQSPLAKIIATAIASHHSGLPDHESLDARLASAVEPVGWPQLIGALPPFQQLAPTQPSGGPGRHPGFSQHFLTRMLFSSLVDADYLETERFYDGEVLRGGHTNLNALRERLQRFMENKGAAAETSPLNVLRQEIHHHALAKAALPPGLFTLTVPTGGGKTLTSLSFALDHAVRHDLRRIIYVIPYTSIIEQTASVFRKALATESDILEHHASFDWEKIAQDRTPDDIDGLAKLRRAAENWDAPVIVTTAVQFFESLFANRSSRCRKLHNIADSVVILDEAQTLPVRFLLPCLAVLDELARNYRTSIVFCTATQPAIKMSDGFKCGLDIDKEHELAPDPERLYTALKRVTVERRGATSDEEIAARFGEAPQMLCIVNSRRHAQDIFGAIRALPGAVHLTTLMCPRHRRMVLDDIRVRLSRHEPVRLVATSLIEAGVDIDFPEVWRAATGLESIAQAAGRCNREGKLATGRVVVFEPAEQKPEHEIAQRWQAADAAWRKDGDVLGLEAVRHYFQEFYWTKGEDALDAAIVSERPGILKAISERAARLEFPFASIAEAFRLIDERMETVIVPWKSDQADTDAAELLQRIAAMDKPLRDDLRRLQQYTVPIPYAVRDTWLGAGVLRPVHAKLGEALLRFGDLAHYDHQTGVDITKNTYRLPLTNVIP